MTFFKKSEFTRNDKVYFVRICVFGCRWFSVNIHNIREMRDKCLHDHPWSFFSFMLWGGYVEYMERGSRIVHPLQLVYRPAEFKHRIEVHQPVWTLCLMLRTKRNAGYWVDGKLIRFEDYKGDSCF